MDAGYVRLEQLSRVSESELKKLHGMGPKAINLLRNALNDKKVCHLRVRKAAKSERVLGLAHLSKALRLFLSLDASNIWTIT